MPYFGPHVKFTFCPNFNISGPLAVVAARCSLFQIAEYVVWRKGGLAPKVFRGDAKAQLPWMARITLLLLGGF